MFFSDAVDSSIDLSIPVDIFAIGFEDLHDYDMD